VRVASHAGWQSSARFARQFARFTCCAYDDVVFVEVSVLVSKAPSVLTWGWPASFSSSAHAAIGKRVVVPLSGRRVTGLVVGATNTAPEGVTTMLVSEVLDAHPVVDADQLALARFCARYYEAPLQDALRLVLPPDTLTAPKRRFKLTDRGERAKVFFHSEGLSPAEVALLQGFEVGVIVESPRLKRLGSTPQRLAKLLEKGLVEELAASRPVTAVKQIETLVPLDGGDALPKGAAALATLDAWLRAFVVEHERPPTIGEADTALGRVRDKAKKLASLRRLRLDAVTRDPLRRVRLAGKGAAEHLTDAQQVAVAAITTAMSTSSGSGFLLEGVTGSGKTEVYLHALRACLVDGKSVVIVVPEIALTPQLVARVEAAVDEPVIVLHSALSEGDRRDGLAMLREGRARVVVGARSCIFAPTAPSAPLGLIIVDEEHEPSLKQDDLSPRYHARDIALWRAHQAKAVCVLGSATPSLESRHNADTGKLVRLSLPARVGGGGTLPSVEVIDLRRRKEQSLARKKDRAVADEHGGTVLSGPLVEAMAETLAGGEQVLLFLNRRGWSSTITCDLCGQVRMCPQCAVSLTLHRHDPTRAHLRCHQCGYGEPFVEVAGEPPPCPACGGDGLTQLGTGTERVEAEVRARFPDARIARLDRDATTTHDELVRTIAGIQRGEVDIVIGTQMIAKGHDWPAVRLVGIVLADIALSLPDFRATERAMSLLTQVAGRAGRGGGRGRVLVQTYDPTHIALQHLVEHDVVGFATKELLVREQHRYPPYSRLVRIRVEHEREKTAFDVAHEVMSAIKDAGRSVTTWWKLSGPAPCPLERLQGRTRVQLLVFAHDVPTRQRLLLPLRSDAALGKSMANSGARVVVDIDPVNML
jgi:primosomal protein N' (replication factor Y)